LQIPLVEQCRLRDCQGFELSHNFLNNNRSGSSELFHMRLKSFCFPVWVGVLLMASLLSPVSYLTAEGVKPIRALLVIGGCCHDYPQQKKLLTEGISARATVEW